MFEGHSSRDPRFEGLSGRNATVYVATANVAGVRLSYPFSAVGNVVGVTTLTAVDGDVLALTVTEGQQPFVQ